jgi:hypothetical protein
MEYYENLIEAIEGLRVQGYSLDFNIEKDCIATVDCSLKFTSNDFKIDKSFRFDANTDPDEESIIYAISSKINDAKGILINGYGNSSGIAADTILQKLLNRITYKSICKN